VARLPCAEPLKPNLLWMARHLQPHKELTVSKNTLRKQERISVSSLQKRLLASQQTTQRTAQRQGKSASTSALRVLIPPRRMEWDEHEPEHFEVDLVHHCGVSTNGHGTHPVNGECCHHLEWMGGGGMLLSGHPRRF
jgi:hypothetical protein